MTVGIAIYVLPVGYALHMDNYTWNDPALNAALQGIYRHTDIIFDRYHQQIEQLTAGAYDGFRIEQPWLDSLFDSPEYRRTAEQLHKSLTTQFMNYPNISDVLAGSFTPSFEQVKFAGLADSALSANEQIFSSLFDRQELIGSFNALIDSNFDADKIKRLLDAALYELDDEDVAANVDTLLGTPVAEEDDSLSPAEKANRIASLLADYPALTATTALVFAIQYMHFVAGTSETAKLNEFAAMWDYLFSFVGFMVDKYKKNSE